jgi:hypothetical protein
LYHFTKEDITGISKILMTEEQTNELKDHIKEALMTASKESRE